ncbi:MAG: CoA pyrophosphatase [Chloroflexi bacterium]|nr:CoA pyrophosphatase [Chloroflexota bacterium]
MIEHIRARLRDFQPSYVEAPELPRAAVLLPLYEKDGETSVVFTRRSELVEHHKGQISFPCGAHDATDPDLCFTALRETWEEIGVAVDHVEVVGQLDEMITISNFLVRPFVGRITEPGPYPFVHSEVEVAEILEVPLDHLRDEANVLAEPRIYQGRAIIAYSFRWNDHVIWGATARILKQFLDLLAP